MVEIANPLHQAMVALDGGKSWYDAAEWASGLQRAGADFVVAGDIAKLTSREPYKSFSEAENVLGFYRKKFGEWGYVLQVRAPGEPPDLSFFAACDIDDDENRAWRAMTLSADLLERLRQYAPIAANTLRPG